LLERDTHPKGEKQNGLTESEHHCTIVLLYKWVPKSNRRHNYFTRLHEGVIEDEDQ